MPTPRPIPPITVAMLVGLASLVGFAVGVGVWAGGVRQIAGDNRERVAILERKLEVISERLTSIEAYVKFLVREARTEEGSQEGAGSGYTPTIP